MNPRNFFAELKRRNVYKVAVAYGVVGWLVMQVAATIVPALRMLSDLDKMSQHREVVGYWRALLYLSLNNKEEALRWLEQGFEERDGSNISWIKVDPLLNSLHGDPRFEALVQKVTAPKAADHP